MHKYSKPKEINVSLRVEAYNTLWLPYSQVSFIVHTRNLISPYLLFAYYYVRYILKNEVVSVFLTLRYCIETVLKFTFQILLEFLAEYNYLTMNFVKNQPVKIGLEEIEKL